MNDFTNPIVEDKFDSYPAHIREKLLFLRQLILETASGLDNGEEVEETLKWGEPSYLARSGSTVRIDWKESKPHNYAMYFHCRTNLVDTFRELYRDLFDFDGNRAIVFSVNRPVPVDALRHCISLSLKYHQVKHLPMLGA